MLQPGADYARCEVVRVTRRSYSEHRLYEHDGVGEPKSPSGSQFVSASSDWPPQFLCASLFRATDLQLPGVFVSGAKAGRFGFSTRSLSSKRWSVGWSWQRERIFPANACSHLLPLPGRPERLVWVAGVSPEPI